MQFLRDLPIKRKLFCVTLATCGAALALACTALFWFQSVSFHKSFIAELESLGAVVAQNSAAPLAFEDTKSALEVLSSLKVNPYITSASIFDHEGKVFARFGKESDPGAALTARSAGHVIFDQGDAYLGLPIAVQDAGPGRLQIRARFQDKYRELLSLYGVVLAAVLAGSLIVIVIVSSAMQRIITGPIAALVGVARNVSEKEDYTTRAPEAGRDEVGLLTRTFNQMLDQIQSRDATLRETLTHAIISTGPDGTVRTFNRAAEEMLGYAASEIVGKTSPVLWHEPAQLASRTVALTRDLGSEVPPGFETVVARARLGRTDESEWTFIRKDGSRVPVQLSVTALRETSGEITGFLKIVSDISARLAAETEMARLNRELIETSRQAGMAEVATGVLHNVGNVLNSVNVSAGLVVEKLRRSKASKVGKAAELLTGRNGNLAEYLTHDPNGQKLPGYIAKLGAYLVEENTELLAEVDQLSRNIEHIKEIVAMQQSYAKVSGVFEDLPLDRLVEDAIAMNISACDRHGVTLERRFSAAPPVRVDRHRVLQILINLIRNAKYALDDSKRTDKRLTISIEPAGGKSVRVAVADNGIGIPPENLTRVFGHGFTTREDGHGFGLHSGANAAKEMDGSLSVHSDGLGHGATFTLELPIASTTSRT